MRARYSKQQGYVIASRRSNRPTIRTVQRKISFGPTTAKYFGLAVLAVLAVIMLTRSTASSTGAYEQFQLKKEIGTVESEIEQMRAEANRAKSIEEIQNTALKDQMQQMQAADHIEEGEVAGASTSTP